MDSAYRLREAGRAIRTAKAQVAEAKRQRDPARAFTAAIQGLEKTITATEALCRAIAQNVPGPAENGGDCDDDL